MPDPRRALGEAGEQLAALALSERGLKVVARNARTRYGELDIVARDRLGYVFVEVKTRSATSFVAAVEAVDRRKRARLARLAAAWLASRGERQAFWRVAVLAVTVFAGGRVAAELIDVDDA